MGKHASVRASGAIRKVEKLSRKATTYESQNLASSRLTAKRMSDAASTHPQGPSIFRQCNAAGPFLVYVTYHAIGKKRKGIIPVTPQQQKGTGRNGLMHETNAHDEVHP